MCTIMFVTLILSATLGTTLAGYAGSDSNSVGNGNAYGYGYSGSFSGPGGNIPNVPPFQNFADLQGLLNGYFDSFKKYHEHFINNGGAYSFSIASSSPNAHAQAQSSITFTNNYGLQQQAQQLAAQGGAIGVPGGSGSGGYGGSFAGDGGASASAGIGPQGGYQSASVYPENPNSPNIFTRFGGAEDAQSGGGPGSYGVFTSSVSSSSNLNGKPQSFHQAQTTINDNGKISTYTVKNP